MNKQPIFNVIDLNNWSRKFYFEHYYQHIKCTYSVTVPIEITNLLKNCKKHSVKLYPAMIYILTKAINQIEELRVNYNDKQELGFWNFMSPCYTVFHQDDKTFSNIWTSYDTEFSVFHESYSQDIKKYGEVRDFIAKEQDPGNTFTISCIPWLDFTAFNLNIYDDAKYLCPIFTIGKYTQEGNKTFLPVSAQVHHAICDGYHAGLLFESIKTLASSSEQFIGTCF